MKYLFLNNKVHWVNQINQSEWHVHGLCLHKLFLHDHEGKKLFIYHCSICHSLDKNVKWIGPSLYKISKNRNESWIFTHLVDSEFQIRNGDKQAIKLRKEYPTTRHPTYENVSGEDLKKIIAFLYKQEIK